MRCLILSVHVTRINKRVDAVRVCILNTSLYTSWVTREWISPLGDPLGHVAPNLPGYQQQKTNSGLSLSFAVSALFLPTRCFYLFIFIFSDTHMRTMLNMITAYSGMRQNDGRCRVLLVKKIEGKGIKVARGNR